jgi:membrane associated rhomboid family serine protease
MSRCDECGKQENMPYQCRHCGGTFCADHRLPENHGCPGLDNWNDPGGVFDSGFDDSVVEESRDSGGLASRLGLDRPGGVAGYFHGNVTYLFLGLMWVVFLLQHVAIIAGGRGLHQTLFVFGPEHPLYVWTWVTSVFAHQPFTLLHIAMNSIVIYFFGRIVEDYVGSRAFAGLFLVSGVLAGVGQVALSIYQTLGVAGILSQLASGAVPTAAGAGVVGASGAGLAIMGVLTVLNPSLRVYLYFILPVPLWLLTIGYTLLSVFGIFSGGGNIAHFAHLVGLGLGLLYGRHVKGRHRIPSQLQFGAGGGPGGPGGGGGGPGRGRGPF